MTDTPSIETALAEAIQATRTAREAPVGGFDHFWMSSVGRCPRYQIAQRAGIPPTNPPDARSVFKMWTGSYLGAGLQSLLETSGFLDPAWHEKPVHYHSYSGKVDGFTTRITGGAIVELKTVDDDAITRYHDVPEHYLWQGFGYCLAAHVPTLLVFQIGKNQGLTKHRVLSLDAGWEHTITQHCRNMQGLWELYLIHHQLPGHNHRWKWEDRFCPYTNQTPEERMRDVRAELII